MPPVADEDFFACSVRAVCGDGEVCVVKRYAASGRGVVEEIGHGLQDHAVVAREAETPRLGRLVVECAGVDEEPVVEVDVFCDGGGGLGFLEDGPVGVEFGELVLEEGEGGPGEEGVQSWGPGEREGGG